VPPEPFQAPSRRGFFLPIVHPDLDRLIRLQRLETFAEGARRKIAEHPQTMQSLDARLEAANQSVASARQRVADCQTRRRAQETDAAVVQTRLARFKDQLMEVKTNREYQAMQHEIEMAQTDVRTREDRILETMLEADELGAAVKRAEGELVAVERDVMAERAALDGELTQLKADLDRTAAVRQSLVDEIDASALAIFEQVARGRKGIAVAEARGGLCMICHVRLRPQVFNDVRRNDSIIQCDSCHRILYFVPDAGVAPAQAVAEP
jgi:uncharacterized protein